MKKVVAVVMGVTAIVAMLMLIFASAGSAQEDDIASNIYADDDWGTLTEFPHGPVMLMAMVSESEYPDLMALMFTEEAIVETLEGAFDVNEFDEDTYAERQFQDGSRVFNGEVEISGEDFKTTVITVVDGSYFYVFMGITNGTSPYDFVASVIDDTFGYGHVPEGYGLYGLLPSGSDLPAGWDIFDGDTDF